ncbi:UvrABC system protein C, partial [Bienertia sinuspersici]
MGRIFWDDRTSRKLLVILVKEKKRGCSRHDWDSIAKNLNEQTEVNATAKQVQNHASNLKIRFKTYQELNQLSGIAYNPLTNENGLANVDLLHKLFGDTPPHGFGGCFSLSMRRGTSYFPKHVDNLTINEGSKVKEGFGDSDKDHDFNIDPNLLVSESASPPVLAIEKVSSAISSKRKLEDTIDSSELKRRLTSFDAIIQLLCGGVDIGLLSGISKAQVIRDALGKMEVAEKRGDEYYVRAVKFLVQENRANIFLALQNDNQRWLYLK